MQMSLVSPSISAEMMASSSIWESTDRVSFIKELLKSISIRLDDFSEVEPAKDDMTLELEDMIMQFEL